MHFLLLDKNSSMQVRQRTFNTLIKFNTKKNKQNKNQTRLCGGLFD